MSDDARFMRQVERAFDAVDEHPALAVLLGIRPDKAETSYGWIEPAARMSSWTPKSVPGQTILGKAPLGISSHSSGRGMSLEQRCHRGPRLGA